MDQDIFVDQSDSLRHLPWSDWQQWEQVFKQLFSNSAEEQWNAIKIISAWESRGKVPVAVESTRGFVEILLKDKTEQGYSWGLEHHSDLEKRLSFSMAIVRFVNGMTEGSQKGAFAKPVAFIGNQLGLPPYLVELRHDATHKYLPTLQVLRHACQDSIQWLYQNYWLPQYNSITNIRMKLIELIDEYRDSKFKEEGHEKRRNIKNTVKSIVGISLSEIKDILIPLLADHDYIIPSSKKYKKYKVLPSKVLDVWQELLLQCAKETPSFYIHLVYALLSRFLDRENTPVDQDIPDILRTKVVEYKNQYYKCWLLHLLEEYELYLPDPSASEKGEVLLSLKSFLHLCLNYEGDNNHVSELVYLLFYSINKIDDGASIDDPRYRKLLVLYSDVVLLANGKPYKGEEEEETEDKMDADLELAELEALIMSNTKSNNISTSQDMEMKDSTSTPSMWTQQDTHISSLSTVGDTHQSFDLPSRLDAFKGPKETEKREEEVKVDVAPILSTAPSKRKLEEEEEDEEEEEEEVLPKKKKLERELETIKLLLPFNMLTKRLQ